MQVHPDIAALRGDRAPQRHAQAAMAAARDAWAAEPGASETLAELEAYGAGAPLEACPMLEALFTGQGEAERLTALLSRHYCAALAANPYGHPPFRNGFDGVASSLLLARSGRAQLILQAREPGEAEGASYYFTDASRFDAVLAGEAEGRIVRIVRQEKDVARFSDERISLARGVRLAFDLAQETLVVGRVAKRLVVLRLLRSRVEPGPGRKYCADTGALQHQSAGAIATSRQEAIVALLGRMGRADAAPSMARIALGAGDRSLRWQAVRECLALDSATGFRALAAIARRSDDPLAGPAGALRAQLVETHPQLLELEGDQCPA